MKTAEEWGIVFNNHYCDKPLAELFQMIQRDAWQQGMDDAITTLDNTRQDLERLAVYGAGLVEGIIALKSAKKLGVKL